MADDRGERKSVRHRLAERGEIRNDVGVRLVAAGREAKAGLDLVEDQHRAGAVASSRARLIHSVDGSRSITGSITIAAS